MIQIRFFLRIVLCHILTASLHAQQRDSIPPVQAAPLIIETETVVDTAQRPGLIKRIWTKDYPSPRTAVLLSLALPGAGQMYNKKWWKLPIVYGVIGGFAYAEIDNIKQYKILRDNYKWVVDSDPNTNPTEAPYNQLDATSLRQYRDQWRRYVELTSVGLGLAYILTATEAYVDAHLTNFDVSDDLTLHIRPSMQATPDSQIALGIGLVLQLGK